MKKRVDFLRNLRNFKIVNFNSIQGVICCNNNNNNNLFYVLFVVILVKKQVKNVAKTR